MEFVDNTGHIFSLPSYKEKPIGYEYEEYSYIFWIDSNNTSKLSVNNYYSRPIYALYQLENDYDNDLLMSEESPLKIEIYFENTKVFQLISSQKLQEYILSDKYNDLNDYIDLNNEDEANSLLMSKLTNENVYAIKTTEHINDVDIDYLMIPIYPIANSNEEGVWISNLLIHIEDVNTKKHEWSYISVGGEFINEYEELIINGKNFGVNLPKDILKAVYQESLYNDEFNEALYNEKLKEYLINIMSIKGECGNFKSAIHSLKWFGYGDKISISKLLKTDNDYKTQYIRDYFNISNDVIFSFKTFVTDSLVSLSLMINKESDEIYKFSPNEIFFGENKPKLLSLIDSYIKVKIGNHDMPIEEDDEKYWYWKPYFNFSLIELGIKLICLKYFYKKYFLPIHLNICSASLGTIVFANDIKLNNKIGYNITYPLISINDKQKEIDFIGNGLHYFTDQIHYVDDYFNEFEIKDMNKIKNSNKILYYIHDTCVNIPINFNYCGYWYIYDINTNISATLIEYNVPTIEVRHGSFYIENTKICQASSDGYPYIRKVYYLNEEVKMWYVKDTPTNVLVNNALYENIPYVYNDYWHIRNINTYIKFNKDINSFPEIKEGYFYNCVLLMHPKDTKINDRVLYESHFSFIQTGEENIYKNFIIYPKKLNVNISYKDKSINVDSKYYEYWVNKNFTIDLLVNNKWYSYDFELKINNPTIDFGTLAYRYFLNEHNYLISKIKSLNHTLGTHFIIYTPDIDSISVLKNKFRYNGDPMVLYSFFESRQKIKNKDIRDTFIDAIDFDDESKLYQYFKSNYNIYSPFKQIKYITNNRVIFNSYMHNEKLVNMNNIDFDIDFYRILQYHLDNNLMYIDGTLLDNEFYQYIIYNYNGYDLEIVIHKDLIGKTIIIPDHYFEMYENIMICAWGEDFYILSETGDNDESYLLTKISELYLSEDDTNILAYDSYEFTYNNETNSYWKDGVEYLIYDKLHSNTEKIYSKYSSLVNLPNHLKYKNNIHLFGIYESVIEEINKLYFYNDLYMYINGIKFSHKKYIASKNPETEYESMKFYIKGYSYDDIDSRYPDVYSLEWINNPIMYNHNNLTNVPKEIKSLLDKYGLYVKRDYKKYFEHELGSVRPKIWELENINEYDINEFTYYIEEKSYMIYGAYYKTLKDFFINKQIELPFFIKENFENIKIYIKDNKYYFDDPDIIDLNDETKGYSNLLSYELEFLDNSNNLIDNVSLRDLEEIGYNKIKVTFYYHKPHIVRNRFYMLNEFLYDNINNEPIVIEEDNKYYLILNDNKIELIQFTDKYRYFDLDHNHEILNQNPAMYWYNVDEQSIKTLPSYLNELERYSYDVNAEDISIDELKSYLNAYIEKNMQSQLTEKYVNDQKEVKFYYKNYLEKDITGWVGEYRLELDTNIDKPNYIRLIAEIIDSNNKVQIYSNGDNNVFTLQGNEIKATIYIQFINNINKEYLTEENIYFVPRLILIMHKDKRIEYDPIECGDGDKPYINVKFLNKEYIYGNNNSKYVYKLYNDFFELKFNIYDSFSTLDKSSFEKKLNINLLESVYDVNQKIKLDSYLNYDFYLMHDDKYWYGLYISQETCNNIRDNKDLMINDKNKLMSFIGNNLNINYILKYERTSQEYLLNRLEFNSSNGNNHFNNDDIIACYIHNNTVLPFNANISSKWNINPMSIGMHTGMSYESNGELTILSLPIESSKYQKGAYKVNLRYSLDRDIQHQFKNTSTIIVS